MPHSIKLSDHLSAEELALRYRQASDPVARSHFHILGLLSEGKTSAQITQITGYCLDWIRKLARRYDTNVDAERALRYNNARLTAERLL